MKKVRELKGMTILSLQEGERLGQVRDVIIDSGERQVVALLLNQRTSKGESQVVATANVQHVGDAAITVENRSTVVPLSRIPRFEELARSKRSLPGMLVITETGSRLGHVADLEVDPQSFRIQTLILRGFLGQGRTISAELIRTIGVDAVVVREEPSREGVPSWSAPLPTVSVPPVESTLVEEPRLAPEEEEMAEEGEPAIPSVSTVLEAEQIPPDLTPPPIEPLPLEEVAPAEQEVLPAAEIPAQGAEETFVQALPDQELAPPPIERESVRGEAGEPAPPEPIEEATENPWQRWVRRLRRREEDS